MLICFEGLNLAGKTALLTVVSEKLKEKGKTVAVFRYPKKRPDLSASDEIIAPMFLAEMFRDAQEIERLRRDKNTVVILSRWFYSTIAYQGVSSAPIKKYNFPMPDFVFLLDADPEELALRAQDSEKDLYEQDLDRQKKAREVYLKLAGAKQPKEKWVILNALDPVNVKLKKVMDTIA